MPQSFLDLFEPESAEKVSRRRDAAIVEQLDEQLSPSSAYSTARRLSAQHSRIKNSRQGPVTTDQQAIDVIQEKLDLIVSLLLAGMKR